MGWVGMANRTWPREQLRGHTGWRFEGTAIFPRHSVLLYFSMFVCFFPVPVRTKATTISTLCRVLCEPVSLSVSESVSVVPLSLDKSS